MYFLLILALFLAQSSAVIIDRVTTLCDTNITLVGPHVFMRVNFDQPFQLTSGVQCTSFVKYEPENQNEPVDGIKLLPYITKTGPNLDRADPKHTVLRITAIGDKLIRLDIFESRAFYLTVTPVLTANDDGFCPDGHFRPCGGGQVCVHEHLLCDGTAQCALDEVRCYTIPSDRFLLFSFLTVVLAFLSVSFVLAVYLYCKFYRNKTYLLSADYKPQFYGTLNGSISRRSFLSSTYASSNDVSSADNPSKNDYAYFNDINFVAPIRK